MAKLGPSIEDLINKPEKNGDVTDELQEKMEDIKLKDLEKIAEQEAQALGMRYINLVGFPINPKVLSLLEEEEANRLKMLPFYKTDKELRIAAVSPEDNAVKLKAEEMQKQQNTKDLYIYKISQKSFNSAFKLYKAVPKIKKIVKGVEISEADIKKYQQEIKVLTDLNTILKDVSTSEVVNAIVALSLQIRASDIHIEAEEQDVKVRYRIDGILNDAASLPKDTWDRITSRIKLLSGLKLNVENKPQDGRFTIYLADDKIDVRVSVVPTTYGESIVMRILKASASGINFEDLGIQGRAFVDLENELKKPNGMIITTGPTGSGKTTSLYSMLIQLNTEGTKILTLEDPVEYKLEGINQSQIDRTKDYTFAKGLRSILRQDPDVIMVGEIRDLETADVAINAALTGHLVLSTLHTNSAAAAIPRFLSMGVKPFLLSPALNAIIGQRLVRRICPDCKKEVELDTKTRSKVLNILKEIPPESAVQVGLTDLVDAKFYEGGGCEACHGIGYEGRIGIYEILVMNKEIEETILSEQISEYKFQEIAIKHGMITMIQDGLLKAMQGMTTVEEVFRVAKSLE